MNVKKLANLVLEVTRELRKEEGQRTAKEGHHHERNVSAILSGSRIPNFKPEGLDSSLEKIQHRTAAATAAANAITRHVNGPIDNVTHISNPSSEHDRELTVNGLKHKFDSKVSGKISKSKKRKHGEIRLTTQNLSSVFDHLSKNDESGETKKYLENRVVPTLKKDATDEEKEEHENSQRNLRRDDLYHIHSRFSQLLAHNHSDVRKNTRAFLFRHTGNEPSYVDSVKGFHGTNGPEYTTKIIDKNSLVNDDSATSTPEQREEHRKPLKQTKIKKGDSAERKRASFTKNGVRLSITGDQLAVHVGESRYGNHATTYDSSGTPIKPPAILKKEKSITESFYNKLRILRSNA